MWRYLNMFVIIGVALIGISVIGLLTNHKFVTEPGSLATPVTTAVYFGAGLLMLFNGFLSIKQSDTLRSEEEFVEKDFKV